MRILFGAHIESHFKKTAVAFRVALPALPARVWLCALCPDPTKPKLLLRADRQLATQVLHDGQEQDVLGGGGAEPDAAVPGPGLPSAPLQVTQQVATPPCPPDIQRPRLPAPLTSHPPRPAPRRCPSEPVGAKAPTFSSDLKSGSFSRREGQSFALLCQAQAHPAPSFR